MGIVFVFMLNFLLKSVTYSTFLPAVFYS